jgi:DNA-binding NtrC family response regulator
VKENIMMEPAKSPLSGKTILAVDDETDVLDTISDLLHMCNIQKATDFESGLQMILKNSYDAVILDVMGVNGFELLKNANARGFPAIILTAQQVTLDALKKSIEMGAAAFLPKELMIDLQELLEEIVKGGGKRLWWLKSMEKTGPLFDKRFGPDWKDRDKIFKEFVEGHK